ncbi:MAG TPA: sigma-70 family RNA polymerase sigma factor [Candidatus Acidoferrum sp.]|nr:sigma-70 family RNA polymerase sigma factor [Candidatus Acidoferrum sp.]
MDAEFAAEPARAQGEGELVARIRTGDSLAENEFIATYQRGVLLIATARTRDREAARDLAQEILMASLKAIREGKLRDAEKLSAFVQGTARNLINNYLREKARRFECDLDQADGPTKNLVEELELAEKRRLIYRELERFSPVDRQILLLSLVDGHSLLEVAQRLKLSHDAVRARRSRMIRKITKKFSEMSQKRRLRPLSNLGALWLAGM